MCKTYCSSCNDPITEDETRWAFDSPYCEDCFDDSYVYCQRCDALLNRSDAHFDDDGDAHCSECWDEDFDDDAPNNPEVYDADREQIIALSRNWLLGKQSRKSPIKVNEKDHHLLKLRDKVGLVEQPLYVFGLQDREEFQISASPNLLVQTKEFILLNGLDWKVAEGIGCNRLGLALSIRQNSLKTTVKLILSLTEARIPVRA
ncbi:MAG: hypothetical protein LWX56_00670 [Ignavibacteria bacterium]|nr:hypothetical protein [Ignavibacteria bacterium]